MHPQHPQHPARPIKLILCPRNYTGMKVVSHTGLAVSAMNTAKVLRAHGIFAFVRPVRDVAELAALVDKEQPTHVVVNALWIPTGELAALVHARPDVQFAVLCHSNMAFLQVEPNGIRLLREAVDLDVASVGNFSVAANSRAGVQGMKDAWECQATYLPNLYFLDDTVREARRKWSGGTLRIGAFGALRPLKNPTGSAFAALAIASHFSTNLEFHVNVGRDDGGWGGRLLASLEAIFRDLPHAKLVKDPWGHWTSFRRLIRGMHLLLQPSFTESFNVVTADGVAEGVASVVSDVIEWAPDDWKACPDNTQDIAKVGRHLLNDHGDGRDGLHALMRHNEDGVNQWERYLDGRQ